MLRSVPARRLARSILAAGCALLAAPRVLAAEIETLEGKRVVVDYPAGLEETAKACRDALEAALGVYEKALPWKLPEGERLALRLCETSAEYREIVKAAGAEAFANNNAVTLWKTGESVLVVLPRADEHLLALSNALPDLTRFLLCHEGFHQFVRKAGAVGTETWPDWFDEGLADHLATECLLLDRPGEAPPPILLDDRAHLVRDAILRDRALPLARLLHASLTEVEVQRDVYAQFWSFLRMLAADGPRFRKLLDRVKALPEPEGERPKRLAASETAFVDLLEAVYGPLGALEARWRERAKTTRASWFEPGRAAQRLADGRILCGAYDGKDVSVCATAPPPGASFALETTMTILGGQGGQADLLFGFEHRDAPRYLKLALGTKGFVTLLAFTEGRWQGRYKVNVDVAKDTFQTGVPVPVRATIAGGRITLFVRDAKTFEAPLPPGFDVEHGSWGVGGYDSVVLYEALKVTPLPK